MTKPLWEMSAKAVVGLLRKGEISPREVLAGFQRWIASPKSPIDARDPA